MVHPPPILAVSGNASEGGPFAAAWNEAAKKVAGTLDNSGDARRLGARKPRQ
jgi:hypothetical protein